MRTRIVTVAALAALVLVACRGGDDQAEATVENAEGQEVGTVEIDEAGDDRVAFEASFEGLEPGFHALHVHDVGLCEPDAEGGPFMSAEGHWRGVQTKTPHGEHPGDLPSLYVNEDGEGEISLETDAFTVGALVADDGAAVMVHAQRDNFGNVPDRYTSSEAGTPGPDEMTMANGDAGERIACGVIGATN